MTVAVLGLSLLAAMPPAAASHVGEDVTNDQQALSANGQLLNALKQFENAPPAVRAARLQQLVHQTELRRERLLALLARNPRLAAARLLPETLRARLPAQARALAEKDVRLSGVVQAVVSDNFAKGVAKQQFFLHVNGVAAQRLELHMADPNGGERDLLGWSGKKVDVSATRLDGHLLVG
ncbi:MAG: hypothetical protein OEM00_09645, partial [Burkholderiaceae bacterium]|nr:hypothetical protein [Burkholderiaceae bacterium]